MRSAACRICGRLVGYRDFTDLEFIWPEGLSHYVVEHQVRLPTEFLIHIDRRLGELEQLEVNDAWWIQSAGASENDE